MTQEVTNYDNQSKMLNDVDAVVGVVVSRDKGSVAKIPFHSLLVGINTNFSTVWIGRSIG